MKLTGRFEANAAPASVVRRLLDAQLLGGCMPGCESVQPRDDGGVDVLVRVGVAIVRGRMKFRLYVEPLEGAPSTIRCTALGSGIGSQVDVNVEIKVTGVQEGSSIEWTGDAQVGGTLASVAAGLVERASGDNMKTLIDNFRATLT